MSKFKRFFSIFLSFKDCANNGRICRFHFHTDFIAKQQWRRKYMHMNCQSHVCACDCVHV